MKKPVSKADLRADLQRQVENYLDRGGRVEQVPTGHSGKDPTEPPLYLNRRLFLEPRSQRTPVPEVVARLEERRQQRLKRTPTRKRSRLPSPRRKTLYDDFGEPLRRIWVDESHK